MLKLKTAHEVNTTIARVLRDSLTDGTSSTEIGFHMTDWKHDLEMILRLYDPEQDLSDSEISSIVHQFLAHVPNHIAAAKKLIGYGPIEDVFGVGVLEDEVD
jgi:hypothetical protein